MDVVASSGAVPGAPAPWDGLGSGPSSTPFTENCAEPGAVDPGVPELWAGSEVSIPLKQAFIFSDKILGGGVGGFLPALGEASAVSEQGTLDGSALSRTGSSLGLELSQLTFSLSGKMLLGGCLESLSSPTRISESSWLSSWASELAETGVEALSPEGGSILSLRMVVSSAGEGLVGGIRG